MCTVTFVPVSKDEFIITHNRDEKLTRLPSELPQELNFKGKELIYPVDGNSKGTWFCTDRSGRIACILNGAFEKHDSTPPYSKSRGIVVLESFLEASFKEWSKKVNLENIEQFTLIFFDELGLLEFRWDGKQKHVKNLSTTETHIWSSATLYTKDAMAKRENWLNSWLINYKPTPNNLFNFHNYGGDDTQEINLKMEILGSHKTVSITQVYLNKLHRSMNHVNFVSGKKANFTY